MQNKDKNKRSSNMALRKLGKGLVSLLTICVALLFLSPLYICFTQAFKTKMETAENILSLPRHLQFDNFANAIETTNFFVSFKNSIIVTVVSVLFIVICSSLAGFVIARHNTRQKFYRGVELLLLAGLTIPFQIVLIPIYKTMRNLNLLNTYMGAIILIVGNAVPYATFLYVGFIRTVPRELDEAASIDGCNMYVMFRKIIFPILKPITATVASLEMLWIWNEFNVSLIVLQEKALRTIPMQQFYFFGQHVSNMNAAFAAATLSMIPVFLFFLVSQKYMVSGMTAGAVKG